MLDGLNKALEFAEKEHEVAKLVLKRPGHEDNLYWLGRRNAFEDMRKEMKKRINFEMKKEDA